MAAATAPLDPVTIAVLGGAGALFMLLGGSILLRPHWLVNLQIRMLEWQQRTFGFGKRESAMFRGAAGPWIVRLIGLMAFLMGAGFVAIVASGAVQ